MRPAGGLLAALCLLGTCSVATAAEARCSLGEFTATAERASYDPFETSPPDAAISVRANVAGECRGARVQFAVISTTASPRTGSVLYLASSGALLGGSLRDVGGGVRPIAGDSTTAFQISPPFLPVGAQGAQIAGPSLRFALNEGQPVPPGAYAAHLALVARVTDSGGAVVETQTPLEIEAVVKPSVRLAAGSGDLSIDMGELTPGAIGAAPVKFDAYSNLDYELTIRSSNAFTLERRVGQVDGPGYVPLVTPAASSSPTGDLPGVLRLVYAAPGGSGRRSHTFNVRMAQFARKPAGVYFDEVILEIRARL